MQRRAFMASAVFGVVSVRDAHASVSMPYPASLSRDAAIIGNVVLDNNLVERDRHAILRKLGVAGNTFEEIDKRITQTGIRQDFRAGNVVYVSGWALSLTEARLCALAALDECSGDN